MALVIGNYRLYTMNPVFDEDGNLVCVTARVNRDIVDDVSGKSVSTLATSGEISVLEIYTSEEQAQLAALLRKGHLALPTLDYGD